MKSRTIAVAALGAIALAACQPKHVSPAERGRVIYMANCVVCHNNDPNLPGSQGPAIAGSSEELVRDRVLYLKYPPGYTPQRTTHAMRALPNLAKEVPNIAAYLQAAAKTAPQSAATK
jgi:mono/diheme cytochrome c family protein